MLLGLSCVVQPTRRCAGKYGQQAVTQRPLAAKVTRAGGSKGSITER